jgi:hypothetical protein
MRENGAASLGREKIQVLLDPSYAETGVGNSQRGTVSEKLLAKNC